MEQIINFVDHIAATTMSVEQWFNTYGAAIMKREDAKQHPKAMGKAAGAGR